MVGNIPKGYKKTEVGVIPCDWEVKTCDQLGNFYKGKGISLNDVRADGYPCIMYGDIYIKFNTYFKKTDFKISKDTASNSSKGRKGDLFFTSSGETAEEIGKCVSYQGDEDIYIGGDIIALTPNENYNSVYLAFLQNSMPVVKQKSVLGQGHTVVHIYTEHIKSLVMPIPSLLEQQAIAETLLDIHELINSLTKLINKKKNIKQGVMQELLTGKKRLDGFCGNCKEREIYENFNLDIIPEGYKKTEVGVIPNDWDVTEWENVATGFSSGATPSRAKPEYFRGDIKWVTSGELNYNVIFDTIEKITKEAKDRTNLTILPPGTFLMAITGLEAEGTRGSCGILGTEATTNQSCMAIFPTDKLDTKYLYYYYVFQGENLALKYCQGTKQQSYTGKIVKKLPIIIPKDKKEQTAIAQILSDMDIEIEKLNQKLNKYKQIKQGMMQELLTGKRRLI